MSAASAVLTPVTRRISVRKMTFAVGIVLAVGALIWLLAPTDKPAAAPVVAYKFSLPAVAETQSEVALASRGNRPAVVNFFAAWCVPCRRELPEFAKAAQGNKNIAFFGIDHQDSRTQAQDLLAASGVNYPSGYDPNGIVAAKYGISTGLPATAFIDRTGHVTHIQYGEITQDELDQQLKLLVGEQ